MPDQDQAASPLPKRIPGATEAAEIARAAKARQAQATLANAPTVPDWPAAQDDPALD